MKLLNELNQAFTDGAHDTMRAARRDWQKLKKQTAIIKDEVIEASYGVGDAVKGAVAFPEVALQYITGTSGRLGQLNPWSRFGSRYEDNGWDSPTTRTVEIFNHMVYGTLNLIPFHPLYCGVKALGVEQYTPFFTPAPTTIRDAANELTNIAFLAAMPAAVRGVKTKLGIPAKVLPTSETAVFKELAELSERAKYAADVAKGQARLDAMKAEMAAAAKDGVAFSQWATNGERGAIILSKPKPIKWIVLAKTYPVTPFLDAVKQRFAYFKAEVIRQIDAGKTGPQILEWYNKTVKSELNALVEAIIFKMREGEAAGMVLHNFRGRISNLYGLLPLFLEEGSLVEARILCAPPGSSLTSVVTALVAKYENLARIETKGLSGVCFAHDVNLDLVMQILENLLQNAAEHRKVDQSVAQIQFRFTGNVLAVLDRGKGMCEAQMERVNKGIRSHNGQHVVLETQDTMGHGYGVQTVHELSAELGIQVVYSSIEGSHTTALLIARNSGIFVPDPMTYIFTDEGNWGHLELMTKNMTTEQRIQMVQGLSKTSVDVVDSFLSKYMELNETHQDPAPAVDIARRILKRYSPYLELLIGGDPLVKASDAAQMCLKIEKNMCHLIDQYSNYTPIR